MIVISNKSKDKFIQNKKYVLDYVSSRSVNDFTYLSFLRNNDFGFWKNNSFLVEEDEYSVEALCTCSSIDGYDIKKANINLGTNEGTIIAIGGVYGDDTICMNIETDEIFILLTETGDGELVYVAKNFQSFLSKIRFD